MPSRIVELSQIIAENTKVVDEYFTRKGIPTPSADIDGPSRVAIPPAEKEVEAAHTAVLDATHELQLLMTGPTGVIMGISPNDCLSLHAIYTYRIAEKLPIGQELSFEHLAGATGLNVIDLRRLLRHAMCNFIFCEPREGYVAHTATSRLLVDSPLVFDFAGISSEERFAGASKVVDALVKHNGAQCQDPANSGFALGHDSDKGLYDQMAADPVRNRRWAGAMSAFASMLSLEGILTTVDWASFGNATMVDVGGGWGPVSLGVAKRFPDLNFIVQDLPEVVADGPRHIPSELRNRFRFMPYDITKEVQPVAGAAIYFFRAIFHNWPDAFCLRILRNHAPMVKRGARLVICDTCLHEPNTLPLSLEKRRRSMDLNMLTYFGSRERTVGDWRAMLKEADPHLHLRSAIQPPQDSHYLLDIEWKE